MTERFAGWRSGWQRQWVGGSTTRSPFVDARLADGSRVHAVLGTDGRARHLHLAAGACSTLLLPG